MRDRKTSFLTLYEAHHEAFGRYCRAQGFGVIDASDLQSETVLKAYESFHTLKDEELFLGFLIGIAKNIIRNQLRRKKFRGIWKEDQHLNIPDEGVSADQRLDIQLLYTALDRLPELQKEAIVLFDISGYSIKEVASIQDAGESAVKSRLKRGREKLADLLKSDDLRRESIQRPSKLMVSVFF